MPAVNRRKFLGTSASGLGLLGLGGAVPAWARGGDLLSGAARRGIDEATGPNIDLTVARSAFSTGNRRGGAIAVNGSIPGPLLRLREGTTVRLNVHNQLEEDTSIHWHGLIVPFRQDGVPGISFNGIAPGQTFTYRFPIQQAGTYWFHSHSGFQEPDGAYGAIVIEPKKREPFRFDREYVVQLTDKHPHSGDRIMRNFKMMSDYYNREQQTVGEFFSDASKNGLMNTVRDRMAWGDMRMMKADVEDLQGFTGLINGKGPDQNWTGLFEPGDRIRLRFINSSAMTYFDIRIPGLDMTVVQADGNNVQPVSVDEFRIGVAETYDVIVSPPDGSHAIVAEAMDRSGMGVASLTSHAGHRATPPALREPVTLTMADMGMMDHAGMAGMEGMDHSMRDTSTLPADVKVGPGLDMVSPMPMDRMDFPGLGLDKLKHRVLRYTDLKAKRMNPHREVDREMRIHLTGNMERYMWSFDGKTFTAVTDDPIRFGFDERVRVTLVNETMMAHPIHLHGHFFELVNGADHMHQPLKHTVIVQPGGTATFDLTANEPGDWAFHCHLLYHMHAGMMQVVTVRPFPAGDGA